MDLISSIFPCIQRRKPLKFPAQEQNDAQPESEASQASSAASRTVPCKSSARMSVRIVEAVDSQTTICPEEPVNDHDGLQENENEKQRPHVSSVEHKDADPDTDSAKDSNVRIIHMDLSDTPTATQDCHNQNQKEPLIPALPPKAAKLPEVKSRMIENIPEESDDDDEGNTPSFEDDATEKSSQDAKRNSTWRQSSRKSLVDIINLLQSTTSNNISTLRINSLKWPLPPKSPHRPRPATALSCRSSTSFSSSVTATVEFEKPAPIVKKERRMGAAMLPSIRLGPRRWSVDDGGIGNDSSMNPKGPRPLFCE
ncbi:uncharacterized protein NFIA_077720 [Aspergillus fischeri NRRL 181]|uniref:Uncharacterized protein n=1 Tax=Neosartorya fischeri (strain ATCC 1020 / DSM 3700 / CBS 544.65 / FGSC A1164 / JCM 1740 / NRRL 181 / WB 181) TaxID=331117 RepID=A1DEM5_NEOFI|nr:conserved hypothetical protein [Aspergillus fischeri NRRL 181]EAW17832.1 conserved hypothetical protein [Aspergillus fischeri NRRL 181]KAG2018869.1 hypothetical protein GB937_005506 [Aspergillus fischeri]